MEMFIAAYSLKCPQINTHPSCHQNVTLKCFHNIDHHLLGTANVLSLKINWAFAAWKVLQAL